MLDVARLWLCTLTSSLNLPVAHQAAAFRFQVHQALIHYAISRSRSVLWHWSQISARLAEARCNRKAEALLRFYLHHTQAALRRWKAYVRMWLAQLEALECALAAGTEAELQVRRLDRECAGRPFNPALQESFLAWHSPPNTAVCLYSDAPNPCQRRHLL